MNSSKEWLKEFEEFATADEIKPPQIVCEQVLSMVKKELNPSPWLVFSKLSLIHFVTSILTLMICPQFGFSSIGIKHGLMALFMYLGTYGCMIGCGAFFLGTSILVASVTLGTEELRTMRKNKFIQVGLLGMLSLGAFLCIQGTLVTAALGTTWLVGGIAGGIITLDLGWAIRSYIARSYD